MLLRLGAIGFALLTWAAFAIADELRTERVLDGKATLAIPMDMKRIEDPAFKAVKYPTEVFGDEKADASILVVKRPYPTNSPAADFITATEKINPEGSGLEGVVAVMAHGLDKTGKVDTWHDKGVRDVAGRSFGYLEYTERARKNYTYTYFTKVDGELFTFKLICRAGKLDAWKAKLLAVVESTRIN